MRLEVAAGFFQRPGGIRDIREAALQARLAHERACLMQCAFIRIDEKDFDIQVGASLHGLHDSLSRSRCDGKQSDFLAPCKLPEGLRQEINGDFQSVRYRLTILKFFNPVSGNRPLDIPPESRLYLLMVVVEQVKRTPPRRTAFR